MCIGISGSLVLLCSLKSFVCSVVVEKFQCCGTVRHHLYCGLYIWQEIEGFLCMLGMTMNFYDEALFFFRSCELMLIFRRDFFFYCSLLSCLLCRFSTDYLRGMAGIDFYPSRGLSFSVLSSHFSR